MPDLLPAFFGVALILTLTPGPDMALVIRNGALGGARLAWWTGLGCCTGIAAHAAAAVAGLSAILAVSATAFTVVKLVGVAYLTYLGVKMLWHSRRITEPVAEDGEPDPGSVLTLRQAYRQGLLCNLLNPKIALLFLTLLPQFVSEGEPRLLTSAELAVAFLLLAVVWWRVFSWAVAPLGKFLRRPKPAAWVERVTGAVLIGLAARVAFERAA